MCSNKPSIFQKIYQWYILAKNPNQKEVDICLLMIISLLLIYNTNGWNEDDLENKTEIENKEIFYANLLHRYLKSSHKCDNANRLFHGGLMLIHDAQRAAELAKMKLQFY